MGGGGTSYGRRIHSFSKESVLHHTKAAPPTKSRIYHLYPMPITETKEYASVAPYDIRTMFRRNAFEAIAEKEPLPIPEDTACCIHRGPDICLCH